MLLRRIFGPNRKWQNTGEDCIMRSSIRYASNIIRVVMSRRTRWVGHIASAGE
jgi:hypothetical protein